MEHEYSWLVENKKILIRDKYVLPCYTSWLFQNVCSSKVHIIFLLIFFSDFLSEYPTLMVSWSCSGGDLKLFADVFSLPTGRFDLGQWTQIRHLNQKCVALLGLPGSILAFEVFACWPFKCFVKANIAFLCFSFQMKTRTLESCGRSICTLMTCAKAQSPINERGLPKPR